jgi:hypothetical protein
MMVKVITYITNIIRAIQGVSGVVLHPKNGNKWKFLAQHILSCTLKIFQSITNNFPNFYQKSPIFNRKCNRKTIDIPAFFALPTLSILPIFSPKLIQNPCHTRLFTIHVYRFTYLNLFNYPKILVTSTFLHILPTFSR